MDIEILRMWAMDSPSSHLSMILNTYCCKNPVIPVTHISYLDYSESSPHTEEWSCKGNVIFLPGRTEAWAFELQLFLLARIRNMHSHLPASVFDMKRILGTYCSSPWLPTGISSSFLNYLALSNAPLPKSKWLNIWNETHQQNSGWVLRSHWL